jgi:hypothetical protein
VSYSEFEMVEPTYFKKNREELREKLLKRFDPKRAAEEALRVLEKIKMYSPEVVETPKDVPPSYLIRAEGKAAIFVVVYPEKYHIYTSDAMKVIEYLVDDYAVRKNIEEYIVLIFYSRKGRLGPAAYLYLGTVIETRDIGVLFINGEPEEIVEVIEKLRNEGRYEPEEEMSVELS